MIPKKRLNWLLGCLIFLGAFLLFLKTSCSSPYLDDSGETATVCSLLAIGHPPGYPLHTLLGRLFSLLPLGAPGLSINLFSCFLAAATLAALFGFLQVLARRFPGLFGTASNLLACAFLGLGSAFWAQALLAKGSMFMLNLLLSIGIMSALAAGGSREVGPSSRRSLGEGGSHGQSAAWLLFGLALAHHYPSQAVLLPAYTLLAWHSVGRLKPFLSKAWLALPGLSLVLYFPLRAACHPAINWGHIQGLRDLAFFVSRGQYSSAEVAGSLATVWRQAWGGAGFYFQEGAGWESALALAGLGLVWTKRRDAALFLGLGLLFPLLAAALYYNLPSDRLYILREHLFPGYLFLAILAGQGAAQAAAFFKPRLRSFLMPGLGAVLAALALLHFPAMDRSAYFFAWDQARNILLQAPARAVLLASGDAIIFPLWYCQEVEKRRPDVALVGTPLLPMPWVRDDLAARFPDLRQPRVSGLLGTQAAPALVRDLVLLNQGLRRLYLTYNQAGPELSGTFLLPSGMLYEILPTTGKADAGQLINDSDLDQTSRIFKALNTRGLYGTQVDEATRKLVVFDAAVHHNSLGLSLEDRKRFGAAFREYREASRLFPDEEFFCNAGNALFQQGLGQQAVDWYQRSLQANPRYVDAWYNLGVASLAMQNQPRARTCFQQVLELDPNRQDVRAFLGP